MAQFNTIDFLTGLFGYGRVRYSQDSEVVDAIFFALEDCGAVKCGESGMPAALDNYYFRVSGRQVKVSVEDYGDITLWGPKRLVQSLAGRISERLSRTKVSA